MTGPLGNPSDFVHEDIETLQSKKMLFIAGGDVYKRQTRDVPPTANIQGLDLVTEGVLTMSHTFKLLRQFDEGDIDADFFEALDADNGGARLARILLEECTELNFLDVYKRQAERWAILQLKSMVWM